MKFGSFGVPNLKCHNCVKFESPYVDINMVAPPITMFPWTICKFPAFLPSVAADGALEDFCNIAFNYNLANNGVQSIRRNVSGIFFRRPAF